MMNYLSFMISQYYISGLSLNTDLESSCLAERYSSFFIASSSLQKLSNFYSWKQT